MDTVLARIRAHVEERGLLAPGERVACLVSGGADSTCLLDALRQLGHPVTAVHVAHGLRGAESDEDARHCREVLGAEVVVAPPAETEAALRELRYRLTEPWGVRATGHTASDQVETVLYRIVSSGVTQGIRSRREDGVVRPLLPVWREETEAWCRARGLRFRVDSSNAATARGLIRAELLPLLRRLHPGAEANLLALADRPQRLPRALERALVDVLGSRDGSASVDLPGGVRAVREYDELRLEGEVTWGPWQLSAGREGLVVRGRRPGDRLAGRRKKVQDLLVDAKVPRAERDSWPIVVAGDAVVAVPGIAEAPGWEGVVTATRGEG